jgi:Spy/CpxP family protein refolding chaperone
MMKYAALVTTVVVVLAGPLAAQQPAPRDTASRATMGGPMAGQGMMRRAAGPMAGGQGMMGCSGMMGGMMMHDSAAGGMMEGMMRMMAGSAEHVLSEKTALQLTADQERRVGAIRDAARGAHDAAMRDAERHQGELDEVMRAAAPDTAAMRMHFNGAFSAMGQAHLAMLRSAALTRAVLSDAQRRQLDSLPAAMGCGMMPSGGTAQPAHRH